MKRMKDNPFRDGKILGRRQYLLAGFLARAGEAFFDAVYGEETDPVKLAELDQANGDEFQEVRVKDRTASAESAVEQARLVSLLLCRYEGRKGGLEHVCRLLGISARTAENLVALGRLAAVNPRAFRRLARLGRTKLYHVARLPEEDLERLDVRKLQGMSEREMLAYLREVAPVRHRKRVSGLRRRLIESVEIVENERLMLAYGNAELDVVIEKTQELFGKLKKVRENAA